MATMHFTFFLPDVGENSEKCAVEQVVAVVVVVGGDGGALVVVVVVVVVVGRPRSLCMHSWRRCRARRCW